MLNLFFRFMAIALLSSTAMASDPFSFIKDTDLTKLSKKTQIKIHQQMTDILVAFERNETYPKYSPSKYSSIDVLKFLSDSLVSTCIADEAPQMCLFGGWPSIRKGSCSRPWSPVAKAAAQSLNTNTYDSNAYCGDEKLFRCNPLLFGPGIEDGAVTVEFPNVNGKKNNSAPWHSGICVDISNGYDGLSDKCQKASKRLDEIRVTTGRKKWRESEFFDENKATSFKALQALVGERCKANFDKLNKDNMCTALNESIGLTATAALAGEIKGITPEMLLSNCTVKQSSALPQCNQEVNNEFKPMIEAMEELRTKRNCSFIGIQAVSAKATSQESENLNENCRSTVTGEVASKGYTGLNPEKFNFYFIGSGNQRLGSLEAFMFKNMTKEAIMARLTNFDNKAKFDSFCNDSICPRSPSDSLKPVYEAMESIKAKENCKFGSIQVMDPATAKTSTSKCELSVEGSIASEGLPFTPGKRGLQKRVLATVRFLDTEGKPLSDIEINIASDMKAESIVNQIVEGDLSKICIAANTANLIDDNKAVEDLAIPESMFVPSYWKDKMNLLRNVAVNHDIKGFRVEVDSTGSLKLFADDPLDILRYQTELSNILNLGRNDGGQVTYLNLGDKVLVTGGPPSVPVEAIANRGRITLTSPQKSMLEEFSSASTLLDFKIDDKGQVTLVSGNLDKSENALLGAGEDFLDFKVVSVEKDSNINNMQAFRYVLAPK